MRGRPPDQFALTPKDRVVLRKLLRDGQTPLRVARRAEILLQRANRKQRVRPLGEIVGRDVTTIWRVCERYRQGGLAAALYDAPRSGRPPVFSPPHLQGD